MNMSVKNEIITAYTAVSAYIGVSFSDLNGWVAIGVGLATIIFTWSKAKNGFLDYEIKKHDFERRIKGEDDE